VGAFEGLHRDRVPGSLAMFDRMIFKVISARPLQAGRARPFLWSQGEQVQNGDDGNPSLRQDHLDLDGTAVAHRSDSRTFQGKEPGPFVALRDEAWGRVC
jgi:hypothetical protein